MQVFVQILVSFVQRGTVHYFIRVAFAESLQRAPSGFVPVQVTVDSLIPVKNGERAFQQCHRVQYEIVVATSQFELHPREAVDKPLEEIASIRTVVHQRNVFRGETGLKKAVAHLVSTADIPETDGEIPLPVQGIPDLLAVRHSHITANATFRQITEQDSVVQRSGLYLRETFLPMGILPVIFPGAENGLVFGSKTAPYLCYEPGLRLEIPAADKLPGKGEYVASLSGTEVMPYIFTDIQLERGGALLPIRGRIPIFIPRLLAGSYPIRARKTAIGMSLISSIVISGTVLMDYEFYAQTELCREQVQRASPQYTFPDTGKKDDAVCQVCLKLQGYRAAIDKRILGEQR